MEIVKVIDKLDMVHDGKIILKGMRKIDQAYISPKNSIIMEPANKQRYLSIVDLNNNVLLFCSESQLVSEFRMCN